MISSSSNPWNGGRKSHHSSGRRSSANRNGNLSPPSSPPSNAMSSHDILSRRPLSPVSPREKALASFCSHDRGSSDKSCVMAARSADQQENEPLVSPHVYEQELLMSVSNLVEFFRSDDEESSSVSLNGLETDKGGACPLQIAECASGSSLLGKNKDGAALLDEETMYNVSVFINMLQRTDAELAQELDEVVKSLSNDSRDMESLVMKPETRVALETYIDVVSGKKRKDETHKPTAAVDYDHRSSLSEKGGRGSLSSTSTSRKNDFKAILLAKKHVNLSKSFSPVLSLNDSGIDLVRSNSSSDDANVVRQSSVEPPLVVAKNEASHLSSGVLPYLGHFFDSVAGPLSSPRDGESDRAKDPHMIHRGEGSQKARSALDTSHSSPISRSSRTSDVGNSSKFERGRPTSVDDSRAGLMHHDNGGVLQGVTSLTDIRSLETTATDPVHQFILPNSSGIGLARSAYDDDEEEEEEEIDQQQSVLHPNDTEDSAGHFATASSIDDKTNPGVQPTETFMSNDLGTEALSVLGHYIDAVSRRPQEKSSTLPDPIPQTSGEDEPAIYYEDMAESHVEQPDDDEPVIYHEEHAQAQVEQPDGEETENDPVVDLVVELETIESTSFGGVSHTSEQSGSSSSLPPAAAAAKAAMLAAAKAERLQKRDPPDLSECPIKAERNDPPSVTCSRSMEVDSEAEINPLKVNTEPATPTPTSISYDPEASLVYGSEQHTFPSCDSDKSVEVAPDSASAAIIPITLVRDPEVTHEPPLMDTTGELNPRIDEPRLVDTTVELTRQMSEPLLLDATGELSRQMSEAPLLGKTSEINPLVSKGESHASLVDKEETVHSSVAGQSSAGSIKIIFFETSKGKKKGSRKPNARRGRSKGENPDTKDDQHDTAYDAPTDQNHASNDSPSGTRSSIRRLLPHRPEQSADNQLEIGAVTAERAIPPSPDRAIASPLASDKKCPDPSGAIHATESIEQGQTESPRPTARSFLKADAKEAPEPSSSGPTSVVEPTFEVDTTSVIELPSVIEPIPEVERIPPPSEVEPIVVVEPTSDPSQHSVPTSLELVAVSPALSLDITQGGHQRTLSIGTLPEDDRVETVVLSMEEASLTSSGVQNKDDKRAKLAEDDPLETVKRLWAFFPQSENKPKRGKHHQDEKQDEFFEKFVALVDICFPYFDGRFPHVVDKARLQVQARRQEIPIFLTTALLDMLYSLHERELALGLTPLSQAVQDLAKSEYSSVRKEALLRRLVSVKEAERRRDVVIYSTACSNDEEAYEIDMTGEFQFTLKEYAASDSSDDEEPWYQTAAKLTKVQARSRDSDDLDTNSASKEYLSESGSWAGDNINPSLEEEISGFWANRKRRPNYFRLRQRGIRQPSIVSPSFSGTENEGSYNTGTSTSSFSTLARYDHNAENDLWIRKRDMAVWRKSPVGSRWLGGGRSTKGIRDPEPINAVHATVYFVRPGFIKRRCYPGTSQWCQPYDPRIAAHKGYFDVNVQSLYESTNIHGCTHPQDLLPWERREVKQRFLHEQSISYNRNWFGTTKKVYGNDRLRQPVCRPKSMEMPMKAGEWTEEWYMKPWATLTQCPSLSAADADLRELAQIRRRFKIGEEFEDAFSWEEEETPECGTFRNVKLKIGERISRVTPDITSSLRRSRWRKKHFPKGTFPY